MDKIFLFIYLFYLYMVLALNLMALNTMAWIDNWIGLNWIAFDYYVETAIH